MAVAGDLVDFALGTDCGGSVRLPGSYCGIFGIRTTHGLVPADGVVKLAPSFDTIGWFARNPALMRRIGEVLLPRARTFVPTRLLIATDAFADAGPTIMLALAPGVVSVGRAFASIVEQRLYTSVPSEWVDIFRVLQGAEIAQQHGAWDRSLQSDFWARRSRALRLDPHDRPQGGRERKARPRTSGASHR